jgi:lysyl endopeptidase
MAVPGFQALVLLLAASAPVVETGPAVFPGLAPLRSAASQVVIPALPLPAMARHDLAPLSPAERAALDARDNRPSNLRRKVPALRVGISRSLPRPVGFDSLPADLAAGASRAVAGGLLERSADGRLTWTAAFSSPGAGALRLHLRDPRLPAGGRAFVFSASGEAHGPYSFDGGTPPEGFWTNTVFAEEIFLQVQLPLAGGPASLAVDTLMHIEHPRFAPGAAARDSAKLQPKSQDCFVDRSCVTPAEFPNIDAASHSVAQLTFVDLGSAFLCTGALLKTTTSSFVPYLLTANHCFANQPAATSLEAIWNYRTSSCGGPFPNPSLFPRTLGSTLLATGETSDFTFVQLSQPPPADSVFLGWTTIDYSHAGGTVLYRLSHPDGDPQFFTRHEVSATPDPAECSDAPQGDFLYSKDVVGGTGFGSSGSPVYLEDLRVVGQELGSCGFNTDDDCDVVQNSTLDGSFRVTFPSVQGWLDPSGPCTPDSTTLCLNGSRFRVRVVWTRTGGDSGPGMAVPLTGDSGYFWFFNAANIELVVKVLDACSIPPGRFWVFAGGLTNVGVVLTVEDRQTGAVRTYTNAQGTAFPPLQDTAAFVCP